MHIHYTIVPSALGLLLVGATERGICSVKFGDRVRTLEEDLRRDYPKADLDKDLGKASPAIGVLLDFLSGDPVRLDLPIDVAGTEFQRLVWRRLRRLRRGATITHGELARSLGKPRAVRAVAQACAANPVALVVPCHRVVPGDGGVGGYRWGEARKARLLAMEHGDPPARRR